jgi:hypothetical protein
VSVLLGNGDGSFQKQKTFAVDDGPTSVAVGDFNGDGKPDLAVTNDGDSIIPTSHDTVSVLLGNGDGTFRPQQTFATGVTPLSVAVADLNGDGTPDLAVVNFNSLTGSALLGNGDGTFQAPRTFAAGFEPTAVAGGDFNRDGHPDLAVANFHDGTVGVLPGNGDGTFGPQRTFTVGNGPRSVAVADFNGDGKPDLVVVNQDGNSVSVLLGNGEGSFGPQQTFAVGVNPWFVAVGDFNGDHIPDLAVANLSDNTVSVLLGKGDGTFQKQQTFAVGTNPEWVAVGDFNGDGVPDLAVANHADGTVSVLLGNGDGTFLEQQTVAVGAGANAVAVGDFNGDGKADLAVASAGGGDTNVSVLLGNGDGTFQAPRNFGAGINPTALAVADFNGDGKPDLAVTYAADNAVRVFLGNGDGTFQAAQSFAMAYQPNSLAVADLNGDGKPDIATANMDSDNIGVLLNQSSGTTTTVVHSKANPTSVGESTTFTALVTGANGGPAVTGTVAFRDGAGLLADVPLSNGEADYTTTALGVGTHTITATYSGDATYAGSSGTVVQQVNLASSSTALTQSGAPTGLGQPVTFTATVGGAGQTPTGTVTFQDGTTVLADSVALDGSGVATFSTTALAVGTHAITAAYSGDSSYAGSNSPAVTVQVNPISSTTTVTTSSSPSRFGDDVTFTATVSGAGPAPTGTVTFRDGEAVLVADVALSSGGAATFSTSSLAVGTHGITAVYSGDSTYTGSTSASAGVTVVAVPPVIQSVTIASSGPGGAATPGSVLTAHVSGSDPDGETVRYAYQWSSNGVAIAAATGSTLDLSQLPFGGVLDTITVTVTPADASATGAPASASVTVLAPPLPPLGTHPGPVGVVLGSRRVGRTRGLVVVVQFAEGAPRVLRSPFQKPLYGSIAAALVDLNGDGIFDAVVFTARRGRRKVSRTVHL